MPDTISIEDNNYEITEYQWNQYKTLFRNEWCQWSDKKRQYEIGLWIIRANYIIAKRS